MRSKARLAIAASCVSLLVLACTLFNPLDEYGPPRAKLGDAATPDPDGPSTPAQDGGCRKEQWPPPPAQDKPGEAVEELVFAADSLGVGAPRIPGPQKISGFDLDNVCTCPDEPSCIGAPNVKQVCDLEGGIDSNGTELLQGFLLLAGKDLDFDEQFRIGERGIMIRLRGWNGGSDDAQVELALMVSGGNEGADVGTPKVPVRDGTDKWTVDPESLLGGVAPPYFPLYADTKAYVTDNVIVATGLPPKFPIRLSEINLLLTGTVFIARIVRDGPLYRLTDGRLVGRWATKDLLTTLEGIKDKSDPDAAALGQGFCGASIPYKEVKKQVCDAVDIGGDPKNDNKSLPCDAVAMTMVFQASPAQLGIVHPLPARKRRCGDEWQDECTR